MQDSSVIPHLDTAGLRKFGLTTGAIVAFLFGIAIPWVFGFGYPVWPWIVFGVLATWGLIAPNSLRPVYNLWMRFGLLASKIMTPLIMGVVYFLVIVPFGLALKLLGKDPMSRDFNSDAKSYKISADDKTTSSLENPF